MKEFDIFVKSLSDGLKAFAKGVETVAGQLDDFVQSQQTDEEEEKKEKPEKETPVTPVERTAGSKEPEVASSEPVSPKPSPHEAPEDTQSISATETILQRILRARNGVDIETLIKETGYDRRKIYNIIYRLKKRNQVKNKSKGVYSKA